VSKRSILLVTTLTIFLFVVLIAVYFASELKWLNKITTGSTASDLIDDDFILVNKDHYGLRIEEIPNIKKSNVRVRILDSSNKKKIESDITQQLEKQLRQSDQPIKEKQKKPIVFRFPSEPSVDIDRVIDDAERRPENTKKEVTPAQ